MLNIVLVTVVFAGVATFSKAGYIAVTQSDLNIRAVSTEIAKTERIEQNEFAKLTKKRFLLMKWQNHNAEAMKKKWITKFDKN